MVPSGDELRRMMAIIKEDSKTEDTNVSKARMPPLLQMFVCFSCFLSIVFRSGVFCFCSPGASQKTAIVSFRDSSLAA